MTRFFMNSIFTFNRLRTTPGARRITGTHLVHSLTLILLLVPLVVSGNEGKRVYDTNCATCHGWDGGGSGPSAYPLRPRPLNFRTGIFKFRSTPAKSLPTDADLLRTIRNGLPGTVMPSFDRLLADQEKVAVMRYLKTFSERFKEEPRGIPIVIPQEPPSDQASIARGRELYSTIGCDECHGESGHGNGPSSMTRDRWGNRLKSTDLSRRHLKSGPSGADIYRTLMTGIDGTQMPSLADSLTPQEVWDLVHYIQNLQQKRSFFFSFFENR